MHGLIWKFKYNFYGALFRNYSARYWQTREQEPIKAQRILKKAIYRGRKYLDLEGYVPGYEREVLGLLEKELENFK